MHIDEGYFPGILKTIAFFLILMNNYFIKCVRTFWQFLPLNPFFYYSIRQELEVANIPAAIQGGTMAKRTLQDLNLIDDFMANAMATSGEYSKPCFRRILSVLLGREIGEITVNAQKIIQGDDTILRGIRLDVEITEEHNEQTTIFDIEPHLENDIDFAKHNRYYQAKIDGQYVRSGLKDFSKIHNLYVITITNFDIFNEDYMLYTIKNSCIEKPELHYEDGVRFLYFNTRGKYGGNEAIANMLRYIEQSTNENAVDDATIEVASYVERLKKKQELGMGIMTIGDKLDLERKKGRTEILIEMIKKKLITTEIAAELLGISIEEMTKLL